MRAACVPLLAGPAAESGPKANSGWFHCDDGTPVLETLPPAAVWLPGLRFQPSKAGLNGVAMLSAAAPDWLTA
ncbi:hypothetical protein D3C81_1500290 [compost metagenome]